MHFLPNVGSTLLPYSLQTDFQADSDFQSFRDESGKEMTIVVFIVPHITSHFLSLYSVCVCCITVKTPTPLDSNGLRQWTCKSCVAYFTGSKRLSKDQENRFGFWHCRGPVSFCVFSSSAALALFSSTRLDLFYSLFQIMSESALWVQVRATGVGGQWQWVGSFARPGPLLYLMNTSKNLMMLFSWQCHITWRKGVPGY